MNCFFFHLVKVNNEVEQQHEDGTQQEEIVNGENQMNSEDSSVKAEL